MKCGFLFKNKLRVFIMARNLSLSTRYSVSSYASIYFAYAESCSQRSAVRFLRVVISRIRCPAVSVEKIFARYE